MCSNLKQHSQNVQVPIYITAEGFSDVPSEAPNPQHIFHAELWLSTFGTKRKSINYDAFSYYLKHLVENWESGVTGDNCHHYITNGAFLQAALNLGYEIKRDGKNGFLAMSLKNIYRNGGEK